MNQIKQLEDIKINIKLKLSALWIAVMFCYIYGDFFTLFIPNRIENLIKGNSGVGQTTPYMLLMYAIMMSLPPMMIFLSLSLKPRINRWSNMLMGLFFTCIMVMVVATTISEWKIFYTYLGLVEIILTLLIMVYAWRWPKLQS